MKTIEWNMRNGTRAAHCIYTVAEADRMGLSYLKNWRDGLLTDWVLADDGFIVQILRVNYDKSGRKLIGTATMTINAGSKKSKLDTEPKESRYTVNGKRSSKNKVKHITTDLNQFCLFVALGMSAEESYIRAFYFKNTGKGIVNNYVKRRARELMDSPIVQSKIKEELGPQMDQLGLTKEWILRQFKTLIQEGENESAKVTALNKLSQFQGMDGSSPILPNLPQIPQATLDKMAELANSHKPVKATVEDEKEDKPIVHSGPIEEAVTSESENTDEVLQTVVGGTGPFNPDAE